MKAWIIYFTFNTIPILAIDTQQPLTEKQVYTEMFVKKFMDARKDEETKCALKLMLQKYTEPDFQGYILGDDVEFSKAMRNQMAKYYQRCGGNIVIPGHFTDPQRSPF